MKDLDFYRRCKEVSENPDSAKFQGQRDYIMNMGIQKFGSIEKFNQWYKTYDKRKGEMDDRLDNLQRISHAKEKAKRHKKS